MFGNNKKKETVATKKNGVAPVTNPNALNSLVHGTIVEGTIKSDNDIRIDGVIKGSLNCRSKVIIGPTGYVEGEIRCANAVIEGKFEGNLTVAELLNIRETAKVSGDVKTKQLIVQSGAIFNVSCVMGAQQAPGKSSESRKTVKEVVKSGNQQSAGVSK
ncbi:MAG: polymer-forming cytoskeletal protein [Bacteroidota bacterium]